MAELPTYDFAKFPAKGLMQKKTYIDPSDADSELLNQYQKLLDEHKYQEAKQMLINNPNLTLMVFGTKDVNTLHEELRNTEIVALQEKQSIYYKTKPVTWKNGDIFIHNAK